MLPAAISQHFPILQVIVPMMAAALCIVLRRSDAAWALATMVSWFSFAIALALLSQVSAEGLITYEIGGWPPPWGIEYRIDKTAALVLVILTAVAAVVTPYAKRSVAHEIAGDRIYLFYTMYLLCLTGLLGIVVTGDAFNLFVFLEISSLSTYVMVGLGRDRRALTASFRYLILGTLGATFYLIGVGMMYMMTGTLNMADLAARLPEVAETRTILVALAFLTTGICLKLALFPLHVWLPNTYAYAPSVVTAFLAATATKVAVYILIRIFFTVFGGIDVFGKMGAGNALMILAFFGIFGASAVAIFQKNVKRMLAYSSVAQVGYMVLGISFATVAGLTGGLIHVFNHALIKCALFLALGGVFLRLGSVHIDDLAGLGRRMPMTMAAIVLAGLSLIGIPLTAGFISKWTLVQAALERDMWFVALLVLASSLLTVVYVWRLVEVAYFRPCPQGAAVAEAPYTMLVPTWIMAGACLYFGVNSTATLGLAKGAAQALLGVAP